MRNNREFIEKVTKKLGYNKNKYTVVEDSGVYEEIKEDVINALDKGIVFIEGACIPNSAVNQVVKELNSITWDNDNGISIIVSVNAGENDTINIKSLGEINAFINLLMSVDALKPEIVEPIKEESSEDLKESTSLKDEYRKNLPNNKIGRKSDATLIKELEEAGFKV